MAHSGSSPRPVALAWLERAGNRRYVESETRIGRGDQNNFQLSDPSISRDHALIRRVEGEYVLSDLDSSNGTFVNGQRVYEPRRLAPGDRVRLATVEFAFNIDQPTLNPTLDYPDRPISTSISQFLTINGQIDPQNYLEGDLRVVTVLFLDLCGFTALSERMSPEQITLVVNQCFQHLTETATRYGGFVDKYIGDAMMVLFGAPEAHADDAERSVRAAIAMQDRLAKFSKRLKQRSGIALQMRVGINTGEVLAGSVGSRQFSAFTVMGDTVNLASRLQEHARVGHILVSETTRRLTGHVVRYGTATPTSIRGKHELVTACEVEGLFNIQIRATEDPLAEGLGPVGRQRELDQLERLVDDKGTSRAAVVCGPPGSGKSRLVDQLHRERMYDTEWVSVRCADFVERGPVATVRSITHELHRALAARPRQGPALEPATLSGNTDEDEPTPAVGWLEAQSADIAGLLCDLARDRSLVFVVDRLDLADSATLALLSGISAGVADADVVMLTTSHSPSPELWDAHALVIQVSALGVDECHELVKRQLDGHDLELAGLDRLIRISSARPGPLSEIVQVALDTGQLQLTGGRYQLSAPLDIRSAFGVRANVQAELDRLTADDKRVLRLCAVIGEPCSAELIADASKASVDVAREKLDRLVDHGYLARAPIGTTMGYALRDEMTSSVLDASLPQLERRSLHEQVALAFQHTYDPGQPDPVGLRDLARHFGAAGQQWQSVEYLLRSADLTAAASSVETAVDYYRTLLGEAHSVTDAHERARLNLEVQDRIGDALMWSGSLAEAQIAFELATEHSASNQRRAELHIKLGVIGLRRGNPRRVMQIGRAVLNTPDVTPETHAAAEALISLALSASGAVHEAFEHAERSVMHAVGSSDRSVLGLARFAAGRAQFLGGDLTAAKQELQLSVAAREEAADDTAAAESHLQLGMIQNSLGEPAEADLSVHTALDQVGRAASAAAAGPRVSHWRHRWLLASAALVQGRLRMDRGDRVPARRHFSSALQTADLIAAREMALEARVELAALYASFAASTATREAFTAAVDDVRSALDAALALELRPLACRARVVLGTLLCARLAAEPSNVANPREAALLAREGFVQSQSLGLKLHAAGARRLLAVALSQLGHWPQAAREFDAVTADLEESGATVELIRTLVAYAEAERACGGAPPRGTDVHARLVRALQLADTLGLAPERQLAQRLLSAPSA